MFLRDPQINDFEFYYGLKCEPSSIYWGGFEKAPDKESLYDHFTRLLNKDILNRDFYVLEDENHLVGYLQLTHNSDNEIEIGYGVSEKYRGQGYGYQLLSKAKEIVAKMNNCINLIGYVREDNYSSKKCFVKNGFERRPEYIERYFSLDNRKKKMYLYVWNRNIHNSEETIQ